MDPRGIVVPCIVCLCPSIEILINKGFNLHVHIHVTNAFSGTPEAFWKSDLDIWTNLLAQSPTTLTNKRFHLVSYQIDISTSSWVALVILKINDLDLLMPFQYHKVIASINAPINKLLQICYVRIYQMLQMSIGNQWPWPIYWPTF